MFRKIKDYFKNTSRLQIQLDLYALAFIIGGFAALGYLTYHFVRWKLQ